MEENDKERAQYKIEEALRKAFRPEFLNRIDAVLTFGRLSEEHIRTIVDIQLRELKARLQERDISISLSSEAKDFLGAQGYDPAFGARPLKRAIRMHVLEPLSDALIAGRFQPGQGVRVERQGDALTFRSAPTIAA